MSTNDNRRRFEELRASLKESSGSRDNPAPDPKGTSYTSASQTGTDDAKRRFEELRASLKNTGENKVSFDTWNEDDWKHDSEFINSFFTDAQKYLTDSAKAFDGISYSEATDRQLRDARNQTSRDLADRADAAVAYINKYKDVIGEEEYARLIGDIQNFRSARLDIGSAYRNQERYYGQWDTEEAYNQAVERSEMLNADLDLLEKDISNLKEQRENRVQSFNAWEADLNTQEGMKAHYEYSRDISAIDQQLAEKEAYLKQAANYQTEQKYRDLMNARDFREKSQYVSTANGKKRNAAQRIFGVYTTESSGWDDPLYEYINGNQEAGSYIAAQAGSYGEGVVAAYEMMVNGKTESQQMNEDEVAIFNYLYATQGKEAAYGYYEYLLSELTQRQRIEEEKYWAEYAKESPVLASTFSVLTSPMKGLSYVGQVADYLDDGKIDQNAAYNKFSYANSAIRGQVAKQIEESGKWGKVGSFAYQTGMSMGDFLITAGITGGNGIASTIVMGSGAAADTTIAAKDRGLNDDQAFWLGTIAGIAEGAMERYSLETLLNPELLKDGTVKYVLKNMFVEGLEEVGTDIINLTADILISKDKSEWQKSIDAYRKKGKSPMAAFGLAVADQGLAMGLDFLGGAISGGIMSGGGAAVNTTANRMQYTRDGRAILDTDGGVDALRQLANEVAGVSDIKMRDSITKQTQKLDDKVTPARVGKLYDTVRTADNQANPSTSQADIAQRLAGKGIQPESIKETAISDSKTTMDQRSVNTQKLREEGNTETTAKAVKLEDLEHYETAQDGITVDNEGNAVSIRGISSIKDGHVVLETEDGRTIDAGDVSYGSFAEAQVYEAVSELDGIIDTETANKMSKHLMRLGEVNSELYAKGIAQAYNYGYYGYGMKAAMREGTLSADLTEKQRNVAYMTGRNYREAQVKAEQANVNKKTAAQKKATAGKVHFDGNRDALTERQKTSLSALEKVAQTLGIQIHVFESKFGENGKRIGENGWYDTRDGSIHIDLHAGANGEGTMLFTAAHELTHFIRQWSPAKFQVLADFLMAEYGKNDIDVDALVREQMAKAKRNGRSIDYNTAFEEVVADSMETMLADGRIVEKLAKLKQQDNLPPGFLLFFVQLLTSGGIQGHLLAVCVHYSGSVIRNPISRYCSILRNACFFLSHGNLSFHKYSFGITTFFLSEIEKSIKGAIYVNDNGQGLQESSPVAFCLFHY